MINLIDKIRIGLSECLYKLSYAVSGKGRLDDKHNNVNIKTNEFSSKDGIDEMSVVLNVDRASRYLVRENTDDIEIN